jgi:hypothetical protein
MAEGFVFREVSFKPPDLTISFERKNVRSDSVEEPSVMADYYRASRESL